MTQPQIAATPYLVVLTAGTSYGRRIELAKDRVLVGRAESCDVRFDSMDVSRTHAALRRSGDAVFIEDLGSSQGTFVNDARVTAPRQLRPGDVITLATVRLRYDLGTRGRDDTTVGTYAIGSQNAGVINNVARDQYNRQVQYVIEQRDGFLHAIAATRTRARWLVGVGFLIFLAGFGLFAAGVLSFIADTAAAVESGDPGPPDDIFGSDLGGLPSGLVGWAIAAVGMVLLIVGIVLHVVATARRKRIDREIPMPRPGPWPGEWDR